MDENEETKAQIRKMKEKLELEKENNFHDLHSVEKEKYVGTMISFVLFTDIIFLISI